MPESNKFRRLVFQALAILVREVSSTPMDKERRELVDELEKWSVEPKKKPPTDQAGGSMKGEPAEKNVGSQLFT